MNQPQKKHKTQSEPMTLKEYLILIGNPGVGKSTLLNGLVGSLQFKSGVSFGGGMTQHLQLYEHKNGKIYGDTPGLSDVKKRKEAALEITKALQQNGVYKLIFVVTLETGRIRPDDVTTINLVLESIQHEVHYGIIINKLTPRMYKLLSENKNGEKDEMFVGFNSGQKKTSYLHFFAKNDLWEDQDDQVPQQMPQDLLQFIYEVPAITIFKENVKEIQLDQFEKMKEGFEETIEKMKKDAQERQKHYEGLISDLEKKNLEVKKQQEEQYEHFQKEQQKLLQKIEEERKESEKKLKQQRKEWEIKMQQANEETKKVLEEQKKNFEQQMRQAEEERRRNEQALQQQLMMAKTQQPQVVYVPGGDGGCIIL